MDGSEKKEIESKTEPEETKRFERKPFFDTRVKLSRDGKYWIVEHVQTVIFPRKYLDVIAQNHDLQNRGPTPSGTEVEPKKKGKRDANSNGQGN